MRSSILALAAAAALGAAATADVVIINVSLDGLQEVPPNASPGTGSATVTVDTVSGAINIVGTYSGLLANVTAAHLHGLAFPGSNAPVIFGLTTTGGTVGNFNGNSILSAGNLAGLLNGQTYINVHTTVFPGGEIRGQLVPAPAGLLALAAAPLLARRRRA